MTRLSELFERWNATSDERRELRWFLAFIRWRKFCESMWKKGGE